MDRFEKVLWLIVLGLWLSVVHVRAQATLDDLLDVLRYTPRSQWTITLSCHFGARFLVIDTRTRRVVAACPSIFTNARADAVRLRDGGTLWEAVTKRRQVLLRTNQGWQRFKVQVTRDDRLGVIVGLLRPE